MFDQSMLQDVSVSEERFSSESSKQRNRLFHIAKRRFDIVACLFLLPLTLAVALCLLALNPFYNKGRLIFTQTRMGRDCKPFTAHKFRSMTAASNIQRAADGPLETDRITPLGAFIRKSRIDELPQILNVLKGDMSLIGPRPDYYDHAIEFLEQIPGYRERHSIRPGISGLAQTELGYIEGVEATRRKVKADLYYIANANFRLDTWIVLRTIAVVVNRAGA